MASQEQSCYTLISVPNDYEFPKEETLRDKFENGDDKAKLDALKKLIFMMMQGEKVSQNMLMNVIRFCLPSQDHALKKVLLYFWEIVPKTSSDGKLLHEMILVCDAYRKDLQHPNEFIRGSTLRFLCKLKEPELLEPLMPSIRKCLEHTHAYVRRNAVLAIFTIYNNFEFLISDGPELIGKFLESDQDASCKRNAFMMLLHVDQARALEYLTQYIDQVHTFGDILQLVIVELIYKVCYNNPTERAKFIRCVFTLLQSPSTSVRYEAAGTLVTLCTASAALKAAASAYIDLIVKEADNNLIVLDRLIELRENTPSEKILQELVIDILRVLSTTDLEVRKKILQLALDLVSSRNVNEMVMFLKKEIDKTQNESQEDKSAYKQLLVRTLHSATIKFPDVAPQIFPVLMEFLSDDNEIASNDVLVFVREAIDRLPYLRPVIIQQLLGVFPLIRSANIYRSALWILAEFIDTSDSIEGVFELIKDSIGSLPLLRDEENAPEKSSETKDTSTKETKPRQLVTADGTYATQSALSTVVAAQKDDKPFLRKLFFEGQFFIAAAVGTSLSKLVLRYATVAEEKKVNKMAGKALHILASIIRLGRSGETTVKITEDDLYRLSTSVRVIADRLPTAKKVYLEECRKSLELMLKVKGDSDRHEGANVKKNVVVQADKTVNFTQLTARVGEAATATNLFDLSLSQALGTAPKTTKFDFASSKLGKIVQLAGFSDPVYAEAYVNVNQYDIVLDVLIVNQTADTLQNLSLEFSTVGDLKLVDKPSPLTLAPNDFTNIKATIKVTSTENGVIFSTISYDMRGSTSDRNCVYLQDIHIDIMDYIVPGQCTDTEFRNMWAEFEWENKVVVNTTITDLREFLEYLAEATNMKLLTEEGDCGYLVGNYCAHSIFGENALTNVSVEKSDPSNPNSPISGTIKVRAKSQGMALSLGDKLTSVQKKKLGDAAA